jgi:hypothetical protein
MRYSQNKSIKWLLLWIPIILFVLPFVDTEFPGSLTQVSWLLNLISLVVGFICPYMLVEWIDRKLSYSDMHVWLRRIVAGIMGLVGLFLLFIFGFASILLLSNRNTAVYVYALNSLLIGISSGLIIFSSYMMYTFMRRSGVIIYPR